ncbi:hypothetical protein [Pseudomonas juntendi]|uniref:hypothetical protein n=1 Tax=Pseudomonas juntendi TaxID=2666183 RepID=UPI003456ED2F
MGNFDKLRNWISDAGSDFYYICTENDKLDFEFLGHSEHEFFFETVGFPKDTLIIEFMRKDKINVVVSTESSLFKSKYEITSNVICVEFIENNLVEIKTDRFSFSMFKEL